MKEAKEKQFLLSWRLCTGTVKPTASSALLGSTLLTLGLGGALVWSCILARIMHVCEFGSTYTSNASFAADMRLSVWPLACFGVGCLIGLPAGVYIDNAKGPRICCLIGSCLSFLCCILSSISICNFFLICGVFALINGAAFGLLLFPSATAALRWGVRTPHISNILRPSSFILAFLLAAPPAVLFLSFSPTKDLHNNAGKP